MEMTLQRWYPTNLVYGVDGAFDRFWRNFGLVPYTRKSLNPASGGNLPIDVTETDEAYTVTASIPGISPDDIAVTVDAGLLTVKGETSGESDSEKGRYVVRERRYGSVERSVRLPDSVDVDSAESSFENGVLTITLPKLEATKPKSLPIAVKS